ncbi:hypothetical protein [Photorhabdus stackebrandtii]|uniref:hypothetical protein n=1 Tax=Photorhabdus stackebrandtii TaxID=1123042 RepID=UPI003BB4B8C9
MAERLRFWWLLRKSLIGKRIEVRFKVTADAFLDEYQWLPVERVGGLGAPCLIMPGKAILSERGVSSSRLIDSILPSFTVITVKIDLAIFLVYSRLSRADTRYPAL